MCHNLVLLQPDPFAIWGDFMYYYSTNKIKLFCIELYNIFKHFTEIEVGI
jgi:hypothetical protein